MSIIADLIRAGVDPELVERVVEWHEAELKDALSVRGQNADIERRRSADRERKRAKRAACLSARNSADKKGSSFPLDPPPHTPPPIIPQTPPKTKPTLRSGLERARARTRLDAEPISFDLDFATQKGLTSAEAFREFEQFADHHRKHGSLMADWQAAWRTWVRNAIKFQARAGPAGRSNGVRGFLENVAQMMADGTDSRTESGNGSSHQGVLGLPERRG